MPRCTKVAILIFHASQKLPFYEEHIGQALAKLHPHFFCKSYKNQYITKSYQQF